MSPTVRYSGGHAGNGQIGARYRQINCESTIKISKISIGIQKIQMHEKIHPKMFIYNFKVKINYIISYQ